MPFINVHYISIYYVFKCNKLLLGKEPCFIVYTFQEELPFLSHTFKVKSDPKVSNLGLCWASYFQLFFAQMTKKLLKLKCVIFSQPCLGAAANLALELTTNWWQLSTRTDTPMFVLYPVLTAGATMDIVDCDQ